MGFYRFFSLDQIMERVMEKQTARIQANMENIFKIRFEQRSTSSLIEPAILQQQSRFATL